MMLSKLIKRLIFVPKCASCGSCISLFPNGKLKMHESVCFCDKCYAEWHKEVAEICNSCALPAHMCTCTPKLLSKYYKTIPSLCFYDSDSNKIQNKIIFSIKRLRNSELLTFLAYEIYPKISKEIDSKNISRKDLIFTWIPRKRSSITKYGFDHGKELCRITANLFGAPFFPIFLRIGGKEQKNLDSSERINNLRSSVILNKNLIGFPLNIRDSDLLSVLEGKTIIIIDDVITTGASIRHGIDLLEKIPKNIFIACIARVDEKKEK